MPYIPTRDGNTIFIADPEEARKKYEEQFGTEATEAAAPPAQPQQQQQQPEEKEEKKEGASFQDLLTRSIVSMAPGAGPLLAPLSTLEVDEEGTTVAEEAGRAVADVPRRVVADPAATVDMAASLTTDTGGLLGPIPQKGQGLEELRAEEDKKIQQTAVALEALQKTGKDPQGFSYGIRPSVPILGPIFSEDGTYAETVGPKTAVGKLASSVLSAIAFDRGVSAAFKAPATTGPGVTQILKTKDVAAGLRSMGSYFVKELVPDVVQDAMFFLPDAPAELQAELKDIRALETEEERLLRVQALTADDDNDFDFYASALEELQTGAVYSVGLRAGLKAGNKIIQNLNAGVDGQTALDNAADETTKEFAPQLELEAQDKLNLQLEENIGNSTAQLHNRIDQNVQNVAFGARAGAESYLQKQEEFIPNLDRIQGELNEIPDVTRQLAELQQQVSSCKKLLA